MISLFLTIIYGFRSLAEVVMKFTQNYGLYRIHGIHHQNSLWDSWLTQNYGFYCRYNLQFMGFITNITGGWIHLVLIGPIGIAKQPANSLGRTPCST